MQLEQGHALEELALLRPEKFWDSSSSGTLQRIKAPVRPLEQLLNVTLFRKLLIIGALAAFWQIYAVHLNNDLLVPTFTATLAAFWNSLIHGHLLDRSIYSLKILVVGYFFGFVGSMILTSFAMLSRWGSEVLETLTAMLNPLPAIALLPLALIWFGLGNGSLIFVLIHSVLWPMALDTHAGFAAVSPTLRMVGRNAGLSGPRYVVNMLIPAALGSIIAGLKIGWAFAWRTLIAAELVFGVSSGSGGLGWFIYENKNDLDMANVFAGLLMVIVIGLVVEYGIFRLVERATVRKWGMAA